MTTSWLLSRAQLCSASLRAHRLAPLNEGREQAAPPPTASFTAGETHGPSGARNGSAAGRRHYSSVWNPRRGQTPSRSGWGGAPFPAPLGSRHVATKLFDRRGRLQVSQDVRPSPRPEPGWAAAAGVPQPVRSGRPGVARLLHLLPGRCSYRNVVIYRQNKYVTLHRTQPAPCCFFGPVLHWGVAHEAAPAATERGTDRGTRQRLCPCCVTGAWNVGTV